MTGNRIDQPRCMFRITEQFLGLTFTLDCPQLECRFQDSGAHCDLDRNQGIAVIDTYFGTRQK